VLYVGPEPSHVTEVLGSLKPSRSWAGVRHGAEGDLANQIHQLHRDCQRQDRQPPAEGDTQFSQAALRSMVTLIESVPPKV